MIEAFWLRKTVAAILLPPIGPCLLIGLGLVLISIRPRLGRLVAAAGLLALLALSLPIVADALIRVSATDRTFEPSLAGDAGAVVILGGGIRPHAPEYGGDTLGRLTLERVRYGAMVARRTGIPVLVTGGAVQETKAEADLMKRSLEEEFGIPVRWTEPRSRNTHENAAFSARILREAGVKRVILVAHSFDMRRAKAEFRKAGLEVIPAATGIPGSPPAQWSDWLPTVWALQTSYWVLYEMLANARLMLDSQ
jgi:uncharacterized SAM-binding protein YcdF (DUF218 family)